ncbi:uncharacterized protein LOC126930413 isoform X1 [Macaca thibetana thibetana]|uniref:uncharacterized protein LOC126930413 isoform X1 n=1 Tax=Macaca thibetana thibetana TaxID=257877 RepID=UPI0021BC6E7A|nr:uncharacterized protein LOC126930413 isoform X1 [Macaca thibetana thibetana]
MEALFQSLEGGGGVMELRIVTSCDPPQPALSWSLTGGLVTFFTFPGLCCTLPSLQEEDSFPRKPGGILDSVSFSWWAERPTHLYKDGVLASPELREEEGSHHPTLPWPSLPLTSHEVED